MSAAKLPRTVCAGVILATVIAGLNAVAWAAAPASVEKREGELAPAGRYKLLIVAVEKYRDTRLVGLTRPLQSASQLEKVFRGLHYQVTVLRDQEATADEVQRWLEKNAVRQESDLVLLVLIGHGVQRGGRGFFLTSEATLAEGGIDIGEIDRLGAEGDWPLVGIVDACRTEAPDTKRAAVGMLPGLMSGEEGGIFRGSSSASGYRHRTWLFSTLPGQVAFDQADLIGALARGLEVDPETKRFKGDPWFRTPSDKNPSAGEDLSLMWWFYYGVTQTMQAHKMKEIAQIVPGQPELETSLTPHQPSDRTKPDEVSLLELWYPQHGDYTCQPVIGGYGAEIAPPAAGARNEPWIGGFIEERGAGFDTTGKALFAELLIVFSPLDPWPQPHVSIGLDAKYVDEANRNFWVTLDGTKTWQMLKQAVPTWCKIPLAPAKQLNYFAVTDLPPGAVLTIRRLVLADATKPIPAQAEATANLLASWWVGDPGHLDPSALQFSREIVGGRQALRIGRGSGWCGGTLGPPVWVSPNDRVEMTVENTGIEEAQVLLEIKQDRAVLGRQVLHLQPGVSKASFTVSVAGLANYFAVTKPTADLRFYAIELRPAPVKAVSKAEKEGP